MVRWRASCDEQERILQRLQLTGIFTETSGPESIADVYNSPRKGTVHLPCWIDTLVMYCWLLLCGSPMIWEDVNDDCCFLCVLNWKDSGRHTPIRLLEPFGCLCTECPSIHLAWGDHSSQHHSFRFLNLVHIRYCWLLPPSLFYLFSGWAVWFGFSMIWASGSLAGICKVIHDAKQHIQSFFFLVCSVVFWIEHALHV